MNYFSRKSLAGIQYLGLSGISETSLDAILRLIQFGDKIHHARLLSSSGPRSGTHCFLLTINYDELVAVKSGFSSGYSGEGPRTLAVAIQLLKKHGADIEEYEVPFQIIENIDQSCLKCTDLDQIEKIAPIRPMRLYEYLDGYFFDDEDLLRLFQKSMPFGIIDSRIYDLAINFETNSDGSIMSAYRRLEDIIRERTGLTESNTKLFSRAFQGETSLLIWKGVDDLGELAGRANLFNSIFMAFRNRRAHREPDQFAGGDLQEFLLLNQLFHLEKEAVVRESSSSSVGDVSHKA